MYKKIPIWTEEQHRAYFDEEYAQLPATTKALIDNIDRQVKKLLDFRSEAQIKFSKNPETSGSQNEEAWIKLIASVIPPEFQIRRGGVILYPDGRSPRQVDIVLLRPGFNESSVFEGEYDYRDVLMAFECKLSITHSSLKDTIIKSPAVKGFNEPPLTYDPERTAYPLYGLLGTAVSAASSFNGDGLEKAMIKNQSGIHPDLLLDFCFIPHVFFCAAAREKDTFEDERMHWGYQFVSANPPFSLVTHLPNVAFFHFLLSEISKIKGEYAAKADMFDFWSNGTATSFFASAPIVKR